MLIEITIVISILLIISLLINIFFIFKPKPVKIEFDEAFSILNTIIDMQKTRFFAGLHKLSKKYAVLGNDGNVSPPTNSIPEYDAAKKNLKSAISKKIVHSLSNDVRQKILTYYTQRGLIDYIIYALDQDSPVE